MTRSVLFDRCSIFRIKIFYDLADCRIDFLIGEYFLHGIHEEDVDVSFDRKHVLLLSPAFADTALQEIALHCPLERLLGNRNHDAVEFRILPAQAQISHARHIAVLSFGKKLRNGRLAAQSFFLRKSITDLSFHGQFLER